MSPTKIEDVTGVRRHEKDLDYRLGRMEREGVTDCDEFVSPIRGVETDD